VFELTYRPRSRELENLEKFVTSVEDKLQILQEFIQEEMDDVLREYLSGIFGQRGVEVYEEVFFGDGPPPYHAC